MKQEFAEQSRAEEQREVYETEEEWGGISETNKNDDTNEMGSSASITGEPTNPRAQKTSQRDNSPDHSLEQKEQVPFDGTWSLSAVRMIIILA